MPPATPIMTGLAQDIAPPSSPSTTSSVTAPAAIASGAITRAARPSSAAPPSDRGSIRPAPAPTSAAANGARNET